MGHVLYTCAPVCLHGRAQRALKCTPSQLVCVFLRCCYCSIKRYDHTCSVSSSSTCSTAPCIYWGWCVQVLCKAAPSCNQLQKEEVWPHQPVATKEEDQIDTCLSVTPFFMLRLLSACNNLAELLTKFHQSLRHSDAASFDVVIFTLAGTSLTQRDMHCESQRSYQLSLFLS